MNTSHKKAGDKKSGFVNKKTGALTPEKLNEGLKSRLKFTEKESDKLADKITSSLGSMSFLFSNAIAFAIWILWNLGYLPGLDIFDPYPFGLLTMIVSLEAIFLSIIVLISQNRQGRMADVRQQIDFEINVRAENEVTKVLIMLEEIQKHLGVETKVDKELEEMKEAIDLEKIHREIEE